MNLGGCEPIQGTDLASSAQLEELKKELQMQRWIIIALAVIILIKN